MKYAHVIKCLPFDSENRIIIPALIVVECVDESITFFPLSASMNLHRTRCSAKRTGNYGLTTNEQVLDSDLL